jgi:hypothetical protein
MRARGQVQFTPNIVRRQSLHATVIRACANCGAPGHAFGRPVGPICPECGAVRPSDENKGEIWSKVWRRPTLVEMLRQLFKWRTAP